MDAALVMLLQDAVKRLLPEAVTARRELHGIPEAAFKELKTAARIGELLQQAGIPFRDGISGTGIIATIQGQRPGPVIALRADMDGLRVQETSGAAYASGHAGWSHCCGHDGHMTCVLFAARALWWLRDQLRGTVRIVFQPGEETGSGALRIIDEALADPRPAAICALHAWPYLAAGVVAARAGDVTYGNDLFTITILGRGGHSARPQEAHSPILAAARIIGDISALNTFPVEGLPEALLSVGVVRAGAEPNVIPAEALLQGTVRSRNDAARSAMLAAMEAVLENAREAGRLRAECSCSRYCPPVVNHPALYRLFCKVADRLLGPDRRSELAAPSTGSEDFGHYCERVPGLLMRLGMGTASALLHNGAFDFNDAALASGIQMLAGMALAFGAEDDGPRNLEIDR